MAPMSDEGSIPAFPLFGGGESGRRIREFDWENTSLGAYRTWPQSLRFALSLVLNSKDIAALYWGPEQYLLYNDAYGEALGDRHPAAFGRPMTEVLQDLAPTLGPQVAEALRTGESFVTRDVLLTMHREGRDPQTWWTYSFRPIQSGEEGHFAGVLLLATEMTEQHRAERQLANVENRWRSLLQQMPGFAAVLSGADHRYEYVNDAYAEIFGSRGYLGRSVRDVLPELDGQGDLEALDHVYTTGEQFSAQAMPLRLDGHGGVRFLDLQYQPTRNHNGRVTGVFVIGYEVTERVRIAKRRETLLALDDRLGDLEDLGDLSFAASELLGEALGVERVGYGEVSPEARSITIKREWSARGFSSLAGVHHFDDYGDYFDDLPSGKAVASADIQVDPRTAAKAGSFDEIGIRAFLDVPVVEKQGARYHNCSCIRRTRGAGRPMKSPLYGISPSGRVLRSLGARQRTACATARLDWRMLWPALTLAPSNGTRSAATSCWMRMRGGSSAFPPRVPFTKKQCSAV